MEHAQIAINNVQMSLAQFTKTALEVGYACNYFDYFQIIPPYSVSWILSLFLNIIFF